MKRIVSHTGRVPVFRMQLITALTGAAIALALLTAVVTLARLPFIRMVNLGDQIAMPAAPIDDLHRGHEGENYGVGRKFNHPADSLFE